MRTKTQPLPPNKVIVWSDGMGAWFHFRFVFMLLSKFDLTKFHEWHYNEAYYEKGQIQPAFTSSKLTTETREQDVKYVQN